ncbi:helicase HerA-like domain-containing protein [Rhodococcus coprophilus]|uniref:Ornithine/acetylornithine aminotransferase n=1 Tax=Rhodococcus coprophilus TaxID=38310 RepID=A0A2X4TQ69_9NOCA|nr:helicase HerA-like domain-containing protein [Rhodococcus coprophilus]MBM7457343.1 DNA helicase HerA-like ATPase [Rhodococcus coprophilus]SQI29556.1 Ornithine/acetylornithine aminotransferase [Rhodococcus coprophilus]
MPDRDKRHEDPGDASRPADAAARIAAGYAVSGPALDLGAVVVDGVANPSAKVRIPLATLNRHGLVTGATGTGKTATLQLLAEELSAAGVPVVMSDVKGDLSGLTGEGKIEEKIVARAIDTGDESWEPHGYPVQFYSLGSEGAAIPVRATVTSFGPILLSKVLELNATQESTLGLIFHWADQRGLALLDLKDLSEVVRYLTSDEGKADLKSIGGVSGATAGVILRALVNLEQAGGDTFFGEPELETEDLLRLADGHGVISLFELGDRATQPALFSTFLMWLIADLFQALPEVGDLEKPKLVFIFDEAHLLFTDASKAFQRQIEQTVKLIRSKGVGVIFCTQLPSDVPQAVLSQLGARIQHAMRAFTPEDRKALDKVVRTYPETDVYDLGRALTELGTGEAVVTVLSETGAPTPVAWTRIRPPRSLMGSVGENAILAAAQSSALYGKYGRTIDRESAYEKLTASVGGAPDVDPEFETPPLPAGAGEVLPESARDDEPSIIERAMGSPAVNSFLRSAASAAGREISRSIFGTGRRRRR